MEQNNPLQHKLEITYPRPPGRLSVGLRKALSTMYAALLFSTVGDQDFCLSWLGDRLKEVHFPGKNSCL